MKQSHNTEITHRDFLGSSLQIGECVVIVVPRFRNFTLAKVLKITAKRVKVEYTLNIQGKNFTMHSQQLPERLIRASGASVTNFLLQQ